MRQKILFYWILFICLPIFDGNIGFSQVIEQDIEIGVIEHLGDTIPLDLSFLDENNKPVQLKNIINKPTIVSLVYFDCMIICPQMLSGISDAVENSDMILGKDFDIITISFDPDDTPEKAIQEKQNFLKKRTKPYASNWYFLTGDSSSIHAISEALGFRFKPAGNDFIHPTCIFILSPQGKITRYLYGTSFLPFDLKMAIIEASKGQTRPTINRVLEYCFTYDPEGRKYTLQVTKITATIIIFCALVLFVVLIIRSRKRKKNRNN